MVKFFKRLYCNLFHHQQIVWDMAAKDGEVTAVVYFHVCFGVITITKTMFYPNLLNADVVRNLQK